MRRSLFVLMAVIFVLVTVWLSENKPMRPGTNRQRHRDTASTKDFMDRLSTQHVAPAPVDTQGVPLVSNTPITGATTSQVTSPAAISALAAGTRGWEAIPGVIRNNGLETFRLEVDTNGPVAHVTLSNVSAALTPPQAPPFDLRDDGLGGDRIAGDFIYTSGLFRYNPAFPMPEFYEYDPDSPAGLAVT